MTNPTIIPAYVIRQYIYAVLKANDNDVWKESNYDGKEPIVPLGEESDLEQFKWPTIIYEYSDDPTGSMYMRGQGHMVMAVRDTDFRRLSRTVNILREALGRKDETARDVNEYLALRGAPWNEIGFGAFSVGYVDGGTPAENEGGEIYAVISIDFDYFADYDVITRPTP